MKYLSFRETGEKRTLFLLISLIMIQYTVVVIYNPKSTFLLYPKTAVAQ